MKRLFIASILMLFSGFCYSQSRTKALETQKNVLNLSKEYLRRPFGDTIPKFHPLTASAFRRFIADSYSFALLGSNAPATGIKVQTDKPSISIKGNIFSKRHRWLITTVELTSAVDNNVMQVFSGDKLNTLFKGTVGFNILANDNWANYEKQVPTLAYQRYNRAVDKYNSLKGYSDTARVLEVLFGEKILKAKPEDAYSKLVELLTPINSKKRLEDLDSLYRKADKICQTTKAEIAKISADLDAGALSATAKKELKKTLNEKIVEFSTSDLERRRIHEMRSVLRSQKCNDLKIVDKIFYDFDLNESRSKNLTAFLGLVTNYERQPKKMESWIRKSSKYNDISTSMEDSIHAFEIKAVERLWTRRHIRWLNVSPFFSNTNFMQYDSVPNTLTENKSFLFGIKGSYNYLKKWREPHRFFYWSGALVLQKVNSFNDMDSYNYKKSTSIKIPDPTNPTIQETITDEESGTAYKGTYKAGFGLDIPAELYCVPWKQAFIPGVYSKVQYSYSDAWINMQKVAVSFGLIWNVSNADKDAKNLLSIVPYAGFSNVIQEYKDEAKTMKRPMHELFLAGVMVGVPINLGK